MVDENFLDVDEWIDIIAEPANKKTLVATAEFMEFFEKRAYRNGKLSIGFLNQKLPGIFTSFPMAPLDPFFEEFDEKIQMFVESGVFIVTILQFKYNVRTMYNEEVPPLVLTLDDLSVGFIVCLVPMALGVIAFLVEATAPRIKSLAQNIRDALVAVYVVVASVKILF